MMLTHGCHPCDWEVAFSNPLNEEVINRSCICCKELHFWGTYPIEQSRWWLIQTPHGTPSYDIILPGKSKRAKFHCGTCIKRWLANEEDMYRLFVLCPYMQGVALYGFCGRLSPEQNNRIALLKSMVLVKSIRQKDGTQPVTANMIVEAIQRLASEAVSRFGHLAEAQTFYAVDPKHRSEFKHHTILAKDARLALTTAGQPYKALLLDQRTIPTFTPKDVDHIIKVAMAFFDFEALDLAIARGEVTLSPSAKKLAKTVRPEIEEVRLELSKL